MTGNEHALAWAWVMQHADLIRGAAFKLSAGTGIEAADLHSDLIVYIVERHHTYDPGRSAPSTWVWWQGLAVKKVLTQHRAKRLRDVAIEDNMLTTTTAHAEVVVQITQLRTIATEQEWTAATCMAAGYEGSSLGVACGCAPFSARRRVARLRDRYNRQS